MIKQEGEKITGQFRKSIAAAPLSEVSFEGTMHGPDLKFSYKIAAQGTELMVVMSGKLEGGMLKGTADFGGFVTGDRTGKRLNKAP
jgi:hypothetical protein